MFGRFAKMLVSSSSSTPPWLPSHGNPFLFTLRLLGVDDPLDPNPLWEHEYAGGASIRDAASERNDRRLRAALDAHRYMGSRRDERCNRLVADPRVFTDVLIRIPYAAWRGARYDDRLLIMADELARIHAEDFQNQLLDERRPRYYVVPDENLVEGEVTCQFGMGVFLPNGDDMSIGEAKYIWRGEEMELSPWQVYEMSGGSKKLVTRPVGIYRDQRYLLFGPDHSQGVSLFPNGFGIDRGFVAIDLASGVIEVEHADGMPLVTKVEGDRQSGEYSCTLLNTGTPDEPPLEIALKRKEKVAPPSPGTAYPSAADGQTIVVGRRSTNSQLTLTALALPNMEATSGVGGWQLVLDANGVPDESGIGDVILMGKAGDRSLYLRLPDEEEFRAVRLEGQQLDCGDACPPLEIISSTFPEDLCLLRLPFPIPYPLPQEAQQGGVVIGGRPNDDEAGIALTLLDQPGSLIGYDGVLNNLVSRRFVRAMKTADGLQIEVLSASYPAYILDSDYQLRSTLTNGAGIEVLQSGEHLHLGLYVLRYDG